MNAEMYMTGQWDFLLLRTSDYQRITRTQLSGSDTKKKHLGLPESLDEVQIGELVEVDKSLENFDVEVIPVEQKEGEDV